MGKISDEHVGKTCKPGCAENTCRYLMMGANGWECGKLDPTIKATLDRKVFTMSAKADNCEGKKP